MVSRSPRKDAFVFIHGFNVAFEDAVMRTAQIAYDLGFDGAPILYFGRRIRAKSRSATSRRRTTTIGRPRTWTRS